MLQKFEFIFGVSLDSENGVAPEFEPKDIVRLQELLKGVDQKNNEVSLALLFDNTILDTIGNIIQSKPSVILQYLISLRGRCLAMLEKEPDMTETRRSLALLLGRIHINTTLFLRGLTGTESQKVAEHFTKLLLEKQVPHDLIRDIIRTCTDENQTDSEALPEVFGPVLDNLRRMVIRSRPDNAECYFELLDNLLQIKLPDKAGRPIAELLVDHRNFTPNTVTEGRGREFFFTSYLGPFFNVTIVNLENDQLCYSDAGAAFADHNLTGEQKANVYIEHQGKLSALRKRLYSILHSLVASASTRARTLSFIAEALLLNRKLAQLQAEHSKLASSTAMLQMLSALLDLSAPISVEKVQDDYICHPSSRVHTIDDTRISLDKAQLDSYRESIDLGYTPSFSTECFYLTAECLQISFIAMINSLRELKRQVHMFQKQVRDMEARQVTGVRAAQHEARLTHFKRLLKSMTLSMYCYECLLYDKDLTDRCSHFVGKLLAMLLRPITENIYVNSTPVPCVPQRFMAFPERYLDAALDFMLFVIKRNNNAGLDNLDLPSKVIVLVANLSRIKNPHLASKFVGLLYLICPNVNRDFWTIYNTVINDRSTVQHMFPSLVKFYADVESTGANTEFYDKFNIRRSIQIIFKAMWAVPVQKDRMMHFASESSQDFIRFVNMLINDTTFLLDESLAALKQIHDIEALQSNEEAWNQLQQEDRQAKSDALAEAQRGVRIWLQLGNETMDLFVVLTEGAPQVFTQQALGERVASMLNHNLVQLCGPKCAELKVKDAKKRFEWDPKWMTEHLVQIYINLSKGGDIFAEQVAQDERSYTPETFASILVKVSTRQLVIPSLYEQFKNLMESAAVHYKEKARMEEDLGDDVPEKFIDALVYTVMSDPVRLPSGQTVDRKNILRHLLSDPTDPFTRRPLRPDELVTDVELREQIQAWRKEMRDARR